ncbi:hypothetical protein [Dietzia sp. 179-F 9C3 NHS]|uniref:hypothetical protein n=1 Tax=Dietzia sp. 179-F 9C3 NHS TaxID=3374295 RepID=UPI00387A4FBE
MSQTTTPATVTLNVTINVPDHLLPDPADPIQLPKRLDEWRAELLEHITEAVAAQLNVDVAGYLDLDDVAARIDTVTIDDAPSGL